KGFIDAAERFGQVGPGVAHADPDVTVYAELVPRYDQRRLLLQQPPSEVRGIDPKRVPQEANRSRDRRDVREHGSVDTDPFAQHAVVPLQDGTRPGEDFLPSARGERD